MDKSPKKQKMTVVFTRSTLSEAEAEKVLFRLLDFLLSIDPELRDDN